MNYLKDPDAIYRQSFAAIRAETDLSSLPGRRSQSLCGSFTPAAWPISSMICASIRHSPTWSGAALRSGAPILVDCEMVKAGVMSRLLPSGCEVICTLNHPEARVLGRKTGTTRSAAAVSLWKPRLAGAVVVIGNAPTALFALLEMIDGGGPKPAAIIAMPVGFVGAAEAKADLAGNSRGIAFATVLGRRGGSAMAAAALNAILSGWNE